MQTEPFLYKVIWQKAKAVQSNTYAEAEKTRHWGGEVASRKRSKINRFIKILWDKKLHNRKCFVFRDKFKKTEPFLLCQVIPRPRGISIICCGNNEGLVLFFLREHCFEVFVYNFPRKYFWHDIVLSPIATCADSTTWFMVRAQMWRLWTAVTPFTASRRSLVSLNFRPAGVPEG